MQLSKFRATWPFQALSDETRLRVTRVLATTGVPLPAGDLARALAVQPAHLSKHLQLLEISGLTETVREGRFRLISLSESHPSAPLIVAAVLAAEDDTGVFADDLTRLAGCLQL